MSNITFTTGIPTAPDVQKLVEEFGIPDHGRLISYKSIEEVIGVKQSEHRWRSIVLAWRKQLYREHNVILRPDPGTGFVAATASERVHISGSGYKSGLRKISRVADIALRTDDAPLTPEEKRARDHIVKAGATLKLAAATCAKQLRLPKPGDNGKEK